MCCCAVLCCAVLVLDKQLFSEPLFNAILAYDPTLEQVRTKADAYAKIKNLSKLLKGVTYETLKTQNLPLAELFAYIQDALKLKKVSAAAAASAAVAVYSVDSESGVLLIWCM